MLDLSTQEDLKRMDAAWKASDNKAPSLEAGYYQAVVTSCEVKRPRISSQSTSVPELTMYVMAIVTEGEMTDAEVVLRYPLETEKRLFLFRTAFHKLSSDTTKGEAFHDAVAFFLTNIVGRKVTLEVAKTPKEGKENEFYTNIYIDTIHETQARTQAGLEFDPVGAPF